MLKQQITNFAYYDGVATAEIPSASDPTMHYAVVVDVENKKFSCSCPWSRIHKKPCKHIIAFLLFLEEQGFISKAFLNEVINE